MTTFKVLRTIGLPFLLLVGIFFQWRWLMVQFRPAVAAVAIVDDGDEGTPGSVGKDQTANQSTGVAHLSLKTSSESLFDTPNKQTRNQNDCSILDDSCIEQLATSIRRIWPHKSMNLWCSPSTTLVDSPTAVAPNANAGLLRLIKVPKSASSTAAGVVLRIQNVHGCLVHWDHGRAADVIPLYLQNQSIAENYKEPRALLLAREQVRQSLFLLAPVRTPHSRALSMVYYNQISFHRRNRNRDHAPQTATKTPADAFILKHLRKIPSNSICDYVYYNSTQPSLEWKGDDEHVESPQAGLPESSQPPLLKPTSTSFIVQHVREIVQSYDFLMVSNRMDESLVVLSLLTNVPLTSILTISSKSTGSWYLTQKSSAKNAPNNATLSQHGQQAQQYQCIRLVPPVVTPHIEAYFKSDEWKSNQAADRLLFAVVNQSLDATIASLPTFAEHFATFRRWQERLQQAQCGTNDNNATYLPCSRSGVPQFQQSRTSCYERDFGCAYPCIDRVVRDATAAAATATTP